MEPIDQAERIARRLLPGFAERAEECDRSESENIRAAAKYYRQRLKETTQLIRDELNKKIT